MDALFPGQTTFWVSPSGDIEEAPEGHLSFIISNSEEMNIPPEVAGAALSRGGYSDKAENDAYNTAFKNNWLRMGVFGRGTDREEFYANGNVVHTPTFENLWDAMEQLGATRGTKIRITSSSDHRSWFGTFNDITAAKSFQQLHNTQQRLLGKPASAFGEALNMLMPSLKKIFLERYARHEGFYKINKSTRGKDMDKGLAMIDANTFSSEEITRLYELEYKIFKLGMEKKKGDEWLPDSAYMEFHKLNGEYSKSVVKAAERITKIIYGWMMMEESNYMIKHVQGRAEEEVAKEFGTTWTEIVMARGQRLNDLMRSFGEHVPIGNYSSTPSEEDLPEGFSEKIQERITKYVDQMWDHLDPYKTVEDTYNELESANLTSPSDAIVAFHKGLTLSHNNGKMVEYVLHERDPKAAGAVHFLNDLSNGSMVPQWDNELSKVIPPQAGLREAAGQKAPTPEEVIDAIKTLESA